MTRYCAGCHSRRPLIDFDLDSLSVLCRACVENPVQARVEVPIEAPTIFELEQERRKLLDVLTQVDLQIADRRRDSSPTLPHLTDLEKRRRSLIASIVKIDNQISAAAPPAVVTLFDETPESDLFDGDLG